MIQLVQFAVLIAVIGIAFAIALRRGRTAHDTCLHCGLDVYRDADNDVWRHTDPVTDHDVRRRAEP